MNQVQSLSVLHVCPELPSEDSPGSMAPAARQIESLRESGIRTEVVDMSGIPKLKYLQAIPRIRRIAKNVDVIHSHFGYCGWLVLVATIGFRNRPRRVMSFMGDDLLGTPAADGSLEWFSRVQANLNKRFSSRYDQVIVKSQEMADVIAPVRCTVIANGVDTDVFQPSDQATARQKVHLPSDGHLVLFPGNPENPRKGHALAKGSVTSASERLGEPIELVPLWNVEPDDVAHYMNACDAMLMTSLIEGSPNVVKEAMACDLPVIGVTVGDVPELLADVDGCCHCPRDASVMGERLASLLADRPVCKGREGLLHRGLDLANVARRVTSIYHLAIEKNARRNTSKQSSQPISSTTSQG